MSTAVIYLPDNLPTEQFDLHASRCYEHCRRRGYTVIGVVLGDWAGVLNMFRDGHAVVAVVAAVEHLDPTWEPRVEIAGAGTMTAVNQEPGVFRRRRIRRNAPR